MVDEGPGRHTFSERGNAAHMVAIVMRDSHVVDLFDTRGLADFHDASAVVARPTSISNVSPEGETSSDDLPPTSIT